MNPPFLHVCVSVTSTVQAFNLMYIILFIHNTHHSSLSGPFFLSIIHSKSNSHLRSGDRVKLDQVCLQILHMHTRTVQRQEQSHMFVQHDQNKHMNTSPQRRATCLQYKPLHDAEINNFTLHHQSWKTTTQTTAGPSEKVLSNYVVQDRRSMRTSMRKEEFVS